MTSVYVAASGHEIERAERVVAQLRARGCTITHDWTAGMRRELAAGRRDRDLPDDEAHAYARRDIDAVRDADVFLFLVPETPSKGAWIELGIALSSRCDIVIAGDYQASIFTRHTYASAATDDAAIDAVMECGP
jgi:hypothetical protein